MRQVALTLLYGLSQIFFQSKAVPGLLILVAFAMASWKMALLVVIGSACSSFGGLLMRIPVSAVSNGHQGFCGALVGAAAYSALGGGWMGILAAVLGGLACEPVTWGLAHGFNTPLLKPLQLPYTTSPFCVVGGMLNFASAGHHVVHDVIELDDSLPKDFVRSILTNISQVVLVDSFIAGGLILLALFIAHWKVGLAAVLGSAVESSMAILAGQDAVDLGRGLLGYSGVLVAIAMAAVFLKGTWQPWVMAVVGTVMAGGITMLVQDWSAVYTWPYVITTWILLAVTHYVPWIKRA